MLPLNALVDGSMQTPPPVDPHPGEDLLYDGGEVASPSLKLTLLILSAIITLLGSEIIVRIVDGGALLQYNAFTIDDAGLLALTPNTSRHLRTPGGDDYSIHTGPLGLRQLSPDGPWPPQDAWLILGDSQVLGMGVEGEETAAERLNALGIPAVGAGVLGHGVGDSAAKAEALIPHLNPKGVIFVVNQINDWQDGLVPATERFKVRGGFAVTAHRANSFQAHLLETALGRLHLVTYALQLIFNPDIRSRPVPPLSEDGERLTPFLPQESTTKALASAILDFAQAHPGLPVYGAFLPADYATSEARAAESPFGKEVAALGLAPWTSTEHRDGLKAALGDERFIDLLPPLRDQAEAFLRLDYHLSARGHQVVAEALAVALKRPSPEAEPALTRSTHDP